MSVSVHRRPIDKLATLAALALGLATIASAWASQVWGGLVPCELCLEQRLPYYWGLPLLALVMLLWNRLPLPLWYGAMAVAVAIFAWGAGPASYHAGVEWGFWPGPTACTGVGDGLSFDALGDLNSARVIGCDVVQFRLLGISLAGFNALISAAIVVLLMAAIVNQWRRQRT